MMPKITFWNIFTLVALGVLGQIVALLLASALHSSWFQSGMIAATINYTIWIVGYERRARRLGWKSLRRRFPPVKYTILLIGFAGAVGLILIVSAAALILRKWGVNTSGPLPGNFSASDLHQFPLAIIVIVLLGPLAEEVMFRGLLLDWLRQQLSGCSSIIIASLLFAILHNNGLRSGAMGWLVLADRFLLAIGTSILALRYQSLRPSFVLHATNNCVVVLLAIS
jgi:membrane protease YdiL (CAAX protease family)